MKAIYAELFLETQETQIVRKNHFKTETKTDVSFKRHFNHFSMYPLH